MAEALLGSRLQSDGNVLQSVQAAAPVNKLKRLPRYFALKLNGKYLTLTPDTPNLTFVAADGVSRMSTHEVVYDQDPADPEGQNGVAAFRSANDRFWRLDGSRIVADKLGAPDQNCYFKYDVSDARDDLTKKLKRIPLVKITSASASAKSSASSDQSPLITGNLEALTDLYRSYKSSTSQLAVHLGDSSVVDHLLVGIQFVDAEATAVKIPKHVLFKNTGGFYLNVFERSDLTWLQFNSKEKDGIRGVFEIIPLLSGMVAIQSVYNGMFWRNSKCWIRADSYKNNLGGAEKDFQCHFEPFKLGPKIVGFKSYSVMFLNMLTEDGWERSLDSTGQSLEDPDTHLTLESATTREISNVQFLMNLAEMVEGPAVVIAGSNTFENDTGDLKTEMQANISIANAKSTSKSFETSSTFKMEVATAVSVGVPEVASVGGEIRMSSEIKSALTEGVQETEAVTYQTTYIIKDIAPGTKVKLDLRCLRAKFNIPFTYSTKTVRFDGKFADGNAMTRGVDGIFERVSVVDVNAIAYYVDPVTGEKIKGKAAVVVSKASASDKLALQIPIKFPGTGIKFS